MRQIQVIVILLSLLLFSRTGYPGEEEAPAPVVRAGAELDYPPFSIVTPEGEADGLAVELMRAALNAMGRDVQYRVGPWVTVKQELVDGAIEALPLVGRTPERDEVYDFTFPYLSLHGTIVSRKNTPPIEEIAQLKGKTVAVMRGDNAEEFLRDSGVAMTIVTTITFDDALKRLNAGEFDAVVLQRLLAITLIRENKLKNLKLAKQPIAELRQDFCFAVHEGDKELLAMLNEGLALVMADGTYARLQKKWLHPAQQQGQERPYILVVGDDSSPPYEYLDEDGKPAGFIVQLTRAIAAEMGVEVMVDLKPFSEVRADLEAGRADIVQGMFYSEERDEIYEFSPVYAYAHYSVFGKKTASEVEDLSELKGKRLAVMRGDFMHDLAKQEGLTEKLILTESQEDALRLLHEGGCEYALVMTMPGHFYIEKNDWQSLVPRSAPVMSPEYCYAALPGNAALLAVFTEGLKTLKQNGEYRHIYDKWLGIYEPDEADIVQVIKAAAVVIVPLLLLLLGSLLWSRTLTRRVAERTESLKQEMSQRLQMTERLQQSEERLLLAQRCAGIGVWDYNLQTGDIVWSEEVYRAFKLNHEEFDGTFDSFSAMLHPEDRGKVLEQVRISSEVGSDYDTEFRIITPQAKQVVWIAALGRAITDDAGKPVRMLGTVVNIDQRKAADAALRERERFFRSMFEKNHAVMLLVDGESKRIEDANEAACGFYGYPLQTLRGMAVHQINELFDDEVATKLDNAKDSVRNVFRFKHRLSSGELRDVIVYSSPVTLAGQPKLISIVHDVTERIYAQRGLEQRTRDLTKANRDLQQFAYVSSHDLQEPLRSISGFLQLLQRRYQDKLDESGQSYIERAVAASKRLQELIESLLAFSRIDTRGGTFDEVNLNTLLAEVRENLNHQIEAANATVTVSALPTMRGDENQLAVLFQNLVSNAIKFRHKEREPVIDIHAETLADGRCRIDVTDNGIGIEPEYFGRIFKIFQRLHTRTEYVGNGMGLAISQRIAARHGGEITVDSTPGEGTTFHVVLAPNLEESIV